MGIYDVKLGDIIEFKGSGPTYQVISRLLKLFERWWDRWGWRTAFVCGRSSNGPLICHAVGGKGVVVEPLAYNGGTWRVHTWFDKPPTQEAVDKYVNSVLGLKYDVAIYFWTMLQYVVRHFFNRRIPRLLDYRYTCWENVFFMCRQLGKPLASIYDCPLITDMIKVVGKQAE